MILFLHTPACTGGPNHISISSGDIVPVILHFGRHLNHNPRAIGVTLREYYYEDCIWIISSVDSVVGYSIRFLNVTLITSNNPFISIGEPPETLRDTGTLLLFGYGHTPHSSLSKVYDASTAKPLNWFALNTSEFWIRCEQINDGPVVEFEIESYGNNEKISLKTHTI